MKFLIKTAAIAAALSASVTASATTFDFSYTFSDGQQIAGSLDGALSGTTITDIRDLQVSLNGIAFAGGTDGAGNATTLGIYGYNTTTGLFESGVAPVLSTVAAQNNFIIEDLNPAAGSTNYEFAFVNDPTFGATIVAANFLHSDSFSGPGSTQLAIDPNNSGVYGSWTVKPAPVPLPAAFPLLASGLGLLGGVARRRRAAK
ncbi:MAG TPA: PEP-CTERM sorting domain-containing protein [Steroidobacteraceae bacterium]